MARLKKIDINEVCWMKPGSPPELLDYRDSPHYKALMEQPQDYLDFCEKHAVPLKGEGFSPKAKLENFLKLSETLDYLAGHFRYGSLESFDRCHSSAWPNHVKYLRHESGRYHPIDGDHRTAIFFFKKVEKLQVLESGGAHVVVGLDEKLIYPEVLSL